MRNEVFLPVEIKPSGRSHPHPPSLISNPNTAPLSGRLPAKTTCTSTAAAFYCCRLAKTHIVPFCPRPASPTIAEAGPPMETICAAAAGDVSAVHGCFLSSILNPAVPDECWVSIFLLSDRLVIRSAISSLQPWRLFCSCISPFQDKMMRRRWLRRCDRQYPLVLATLSRMTWQRREIRPRSVADFCRVVPISGACIPVNHKHGIVSRLFATCSSPLTPLRHYHDERVNPSARNGILSLRWA